MRVKRYGRTLLTTATVVAGAALFLAAPVASAAETGNIYGREACEQVRDQYRAMGYNARCNHVHGDIYYVNYSKPKPGERPNSGSAGSS